MKIFKKVDKILASFGNVRAMKRTHVDTFTEEKISNIKSEKYGVSEYGILYIDFQELAEYFFLETTILSNTDFKTNKGATLTFKSDTTELNLNSDDYMIESDFSNVSNRYITKISYPVSKEELMKVQNKDFLSVEFKVKKHTINFEVHIKN